MVVINPYEVHGLDLPADHNRIAMTLMLPDSFVKIAGISPETQHIQNQILKDPQCSLFCKEIYNTVKTPVTTGTQAKQIGLVYQLFAYLLDTYAQTQSTNQSRHVTTQMDHLTPALNWIEKHFPEKITVHELASLANISPSYFAHLFKTYLRQTPLEYIEQCRLLSAQKQLKASNDSIESIAYLNGFSSSKALNRACKRRSGLTANQYHHKNS